MPSNPYHRRGPVIDNEIYANHTKSLNLTAEPEDIADFRHQVDEYLAQDDSRWLDEGEQRKGQTMTIFTVFFGVWEIWDFVNLPEQAVMEAVTECLLSLFAQLDRLVQAKSVSSVRPTIIMPKVPDPTFFPRWIARRTAPNGSDVHGQIQRQAVVLTDIWNHLLEKQATSWNKAHVVLPDFHTWMINQMREPEMEETGLSAIWKGKGDARFTELTQPCVNYTALFQQNSKETRPLAACEDPSRHLFWYVKALAEFFV